MKYWCVETTLPRCALENVNLDRGMSEAEQGYRKIIRRHVVANQDISNGSRISPSDLVLKRTSSESFVTDLSLVFQKTLRRDILQNTPILPDDII